MAGIKYRWWTDCPKNVSRREYDRYSLVQFGMIVTGGMTAICFLTAVMNLFTLGVKPWGDAPSMSVADALQAKRDQPIFMIEGRLVADPPLAMPDDPNLNIIAGNVQLIVTEDGLESATLWEWQSTEDNLFLEQDQKRIPFKLDPVILPLTEDRLARPELIYDGDSVRLGKLIAVEYNGDRYPLPEAYLNLPDRPVVKLNRQYFINGQRVVLLAGLRHEGGDPQLVPPLGQKAQLWLGTSDHVAAQKIKAIPMLLILGAGCATACYVLARKYRRLRQEIIEKSNA